MRKMPQMDEIKQAIRVDVTTYSGNISSKWSLNQIPLQTLQSTKKIKKKKKGIEKARKQKTMKKIQKHCVKFINSP